MAWFRIRSSAVVGVCVLLAACGGSKNPPPMTPSAETEGKGGPAEIGKPAPDLKVATLNGQGSISLESLSGKIAVVDFWATWCGPCKQSFPKLEELAKQNAGTVQVVGISVDDKADGVADFAKANGATFPVGWDEGHAIASRWNVDKMPTTYILDGTGTVRFIHAGYKDGEADEMAKELATLVSESGGKPAVAVEKVDKPAETPPAAADATPPATDTPAADTPPKKGGKKVGTKKGGGAKPKKKKK